MNFSNPMDPGNYSLAYFNIDDSATSRARECNSYIPYTAAGQQNTCSERTYRTLGILSAKTFEQNVVENPITRPTGMHFSELEHDISQSSEINIKYKRCPVKNVLDILPTPDINSNACVLLLTWEKNGQSGGHTVFASRNANNQLVVADPSTGEVIMGTSTEISDALKQKSFIVRNSFIPVVKIGDAPIPTFSRDTTNINIKKVLGGKTKRRKYKRSRRY